MLDDAKAGRINLIICKDMSRFGRNYIQVGQYVDYLFPIKDEFLRLKLIRNDVMHAHYISYSTFLKANKLFKSINDELSGENDRLVQFPENAKKDEAISNVINSILAEYGDTPISVVEAWLITSGADIKEYLKNILDS